MVDQLAAGDDEPWAGIWVWRKLNFDFSAAPGMIMAAAQTILSPEELRRTSPYDPDDDEDCLLSFDAPSNRELLNLLLDGDGQRFVERLVSQFDLMARFVPVLDRVFQRCTKEGPS